MLLVSGFTGFLFTGIADDPYDWTIDGDKVYINNSDCYASASPHTLSGWGWVEFEFESKNYDGDVDFVWGFDIDTAKPRAGSVQSWKNITHIYYDIVESDVWGFANFWGVTGFTNVGIENYTDYDVLWGTSNNTMLFNVTYDNGSRQDVVAFSDYQNIDNNYRIYGYKKGYVNSWDNQTYPDWVDIDLGFEKINYNHGGMDTWYLLKDQPIQSNHRYKIRCWIDVPFGGLDGNSGKYWWAFKPSGETIQQAIDNNHFYALDPWWNSNWDYYKTLTIDSSQVDDALKNFPILVNLTDTDLRDNVEFGDGRDIAFTLSDNSTQLSHEIENFTIGTGALVAWVNITNIPDNQDLQINMYYGNSGASSQEDKTGTWNTDYVAVYHMNDSNIWDSTVYANHGSNQGSDDHSSGRFGRARDFIQANTDYIIIDDVGDDLPSDYFDTTFEMWINNDIDTGNDIWLDMRKDEDITPVKHREGEASGIEANSWYGTVEDTSYFDTGTGTDDVDVWHYLHVTVESGNQQINHNVKPGESHNDNSINDENDHNAICCAGTALGVLCPDGQVDEVRISKVKRNHSWMVTSYNTMKNSTAGSGFIKSLSSEHSAPAGDNNNVPVLSNENPTNQSTGMDLTPLLNVTVNDPDGDQMNISWYSNSSGTWQEFAPSNNSINNGSYSQTNTNFSSFSTRYWWSVNVSDGNGGWTNQTFWFITLHNGVPVLSNPNPQNNTIAHNLSFIWNVTIEDPEGDTFNWTIETYNGQSNSADGDTNGSKSINIQVPLVNTTYTVWVNVTDSFNWTNESFQFTSINFASGVGTEHSPFNITHIEHLWNMRFNTSANYSLLNNLDFNDDSSYLWGSHMSENVTGEGWMPIGRNRWALSGEEGGQFMGHFNGNNFTINHLYINRSTPGYTGSDIGLFGYCKESEIKNIGVINANVSADQTVGILIGEMSHRGYVNNSYTTGQVRGNGTVSTIVGGFIGGTTGLTVYSDDLVVNRSYSTANVSSRGYNAGGFIGYNYRATINNSYSTGSVHVSEEDDSAGFAGVNNEGLIRNCFSIGKVTGSNAEGFIGWDGVDPIEKNCFWDIETSGQATSEGGIGKTTAEMKTFSTYSAWDIDQPHTDLNDGYPYLAWQNNTVGYIWLMPNSFPSGTINTTTNIENNSAVLNGYLSEDGNEDCWVRFQYKLKDTDFVHGTNTTYNKNQNSKQTYNNLVSLSPSSLYNTRIQINNTIGNFNSTHTTFLTRPTNTTSPFNTSGADWINISWSRSGDENSSVVIRNSTSYPTSLTDGTLVYNSTNPWYNDTGVSGKYYYSVWTYAEWIQDSTKYHSFSSNYTQIQGNAQNLQPVFSNENPSNNTPDRPITFTPVQVTIEDPDGDTFNWTIEVEPSGDSNNADGDTNGSKNCALTTPLSFGTTYTWYVNATDGWGWTNESYNFITRNQYIPSPPTGFTASFANRTIINLAWTNNGTNNTIVEWNNAPSWTRGDGNEIYNGTGTSYSHTGLSFGTTYYYQAWSYNSTDNVYSTTNSSVSNHTAYNLNTTYHNEDPVNNSVNQPLSLTWNITINDPEGDTFNWTIESYNGQTASGNDENNGTKSLSIIGLSHNTLYNVWVNSTDGYNNTNASYIFTTKSNNPVVFSGENPVNNSVNQPLSLTWNVTIEDPDGHTFNWSIEVEPSGNSTNANTDTNGSKSISISHLNYNTLYTVYVNATDSYSNTNASYSFTTRAKAQPLLPTNYNVANVDEDSLTITWTKGVNATHTYIERNTTTSGTSWTRGQGTNIYNSTGLTYTDTGLNAHTNYTYRFWSFNSTDKVFNNSNVSSYNWTSPGNPTNVVLDVNGTTLEFSWINGTGCNTTVIVQKTNSYPTNPADGVEIYNNTHSNYTKPSFNTSDRFTLFTYNATTGFYSSGVDAEWGLLVIGVWKEDEPHIAIGNYTVFITNSDASETYQAVNQNNYVELNVDDVPNGEDIIIQISKNGYKSRTQTMDLNVNEQYNISFYLPPSTEGSPDGEKDEPWYVPPQGILITDVFSVDDYTTDETETLECSPDDLETIHVYNSSIYGGWIEVPDNKYSISGDTLTINSTVLDKNSTLIRVTYYCDADSEYSSHYIITVDDDVGEAVEDAYFIIQRYINISGEYEDVFSDYTDSSGQVEIDLIADTVYYITISKTNYKNTTSFWSPPTISQWDDSQKTFILYPEDTDYIEPTTSSIIDFYGNTSLGNAYVFFYDNSSLCSNIEIFVYEINTTTNSSSLFLNYTVSSFSWNTSFDVNTSHNYLVVLRCSYNGSDYNSSFYLNPSYTDEPGKTSKQEFEQKFEDVFGKNVLTWAGTFGCLILLLVLFSFGQSNAGVSMILAGFIMLGINVAFNLVLLSAGISIIIIIFGILVQWQISKRSVKR